MLILLTLVLSAGGWFAVGKYYVWTDIDVQRVNQQLEFYKQKVMSEPNNAKARVEFDKDGNLYVVDTGNQRVQVFDKDGKLVKIINGSPEGKGSSVLVNPRGIGIDSRGIVYIVSNLTHFVYGFDKNDMTGKSLFAFGGNGESNSQFSLPNGLYVDENDQVYITDTTNQRVAIYR